MHQAVQLALESAPRPAFADGDTITILEDPNAQHRIRLFAINAPEKGQPFGTKAREQLAGKVFGQVVRVEVIDVDRYHREVGRIYLGERFINAELVREGFAWRYPQYDKASEFTDAERKALLPRTHGSPLPKCRSRSPDAKSLAVRKLSAAGIKSA